MVARRSNSQSGKHSIPNPCVRNCCLDNNDVCLGCYRTYLEIINWNASSEEDKQLILTLCEQRRAKRTL